MWYVDYVECVSDDTEIPLQYSASIDNDLADVPTSKMSANGMENMMNESEKHYYVKPGNKFVKDFGATTVFEWNVW